MKKIFLLLVTVSISLHGTIKPVAQNYVQSVLLNAIENGSTTQVSLCLWKGDSPNDRINETQETPPMFAIHQLAKEAKNNYRISMRLKDIGISSLCFTGGLTGMVIGLLLILKSNLADQGMSSSEIVLAHSGLGVVLLSGIASAVAGAPFFERATYSQTLMLYKRFKIIKKLLNHAEIDIHLTNESGESALDIVRSYIADNPNCDHLVKVMKKVESLLLEKA